MTFVIIGLGIMFFLIGFILTENNAGSLLSPYNTMSKEEKKGVDIKSYIAFFRNFHFFLGASFIFIGLILHYFVNKSAGGIFLGVYPVLAYIWFIWQNRKYFNGKRGASLKVGIIILAITLVGVIILFGVGYWPHKIIIHSDSIKITGMYGETIFFEEIQNMEKVFSIPKIEMRKNGFSSGKIHKGYFKTHEGETIKLIIDSDECPILLIQKNDGYKVYISNSIIDEGELFDKVETYMGK